MFSWLYFDALCTTQIYFHMSENVYMLCSLDECNVKHHGGFPMVWSYCHCCCHVFYLNLYLLCGFVVCCRSLAQPRWKTELPSMFWCSIGAWGEEIGSWRGAQSSGGTRAVTRDLWWRRLSKHILNLPKVWGVGPSASEFSLVPLWILFLVESTEINTLSVLHFI